MTPPGSVRALDRLLPFIALGTLGLSLAVVLGHAGSTLGYDLQAYVGAGGRVLHGQPLYDASADVAGPFAVYLYPPPFALVAVLLALLPGAIVTGGWTLLLVAAFLGGLALTPVSWRVRWLVVLLAALSWPFLYAIKLGQVEPLLILAFAATWRWLDRPAPVGISAALGALVKVQPALLFGWALGTRRWRALVVGLVVVVAASAIATVAFGPGVWADYAALLGRVSDPVTTPHDFTPGAIAYQAGWPVAAARLLQLASMVGVVAVVVGAWFLVDAEASLMTTIVATQLLSPVLWDHYAAILLVPVAFLLERRQWWASVIPLAFWLPAPAYPVLFWICLVAPMVGSRRAVPTTLRAPAAGR